jgi:hypothetical protein
MSDTLSTIERGAPDFIITPEPVEPSVADGIITSPDAEQVYTHAHSDGQEFSGTVEQARKVCSAMGRMTLENVRATLQENDLAARISQRGREKRQAESAKQTENQDRSQVIHISEKQKTIPVTLMTDSNEPDKNVPDITHVSIHTETDTMSGNEAANASLTTVVESIRNTSSPQKVPDIHKVHVLLDGAEQMSQLADEKPEHSGRTAGMESGYVDELVLQNVDSSIKQPAEVEPGIVPQSEIIMPAKRAEEQPSVIVRQDYQPDESPVTVYAEPDLELTSGENKQDFETIDSTDPVYSLAQAGVPEEFQLPSLAEADELTEILELIADYELLEPGEISRFTEDSTDNMVGRLELEMVTSEQQAIIATPELPAAAADIVIAISELAEALVSEEAKEVHNIIEEIIRLPNSLSVSSAAEDANVDQTLSDLFVELFERAGIEYGPELIESFVVLTRAHYLEELLPLLTETEINAPRLPDEIGTREFLQKLQHGLSRIKQTVNHYYELGKSALRLYDMDQTLYRAYGR